MNSHRTSVVYYIEIKVYYFLLMLQSTKLQSSKTARILKRSTNKKSTQIMLLRGQIEKHRHCSSNNF